MVKTTMPNQFDKHTANITDEDYQRLAKILIEAIPTDRKEMLSGKVMIYIASETLRHLEKEGQPPRISTKAIHTDLEGNRNQEPSQWLSSIWRNIETRHYPELKERLIELCRNAELKFYPVLVKDEGSPAFYRLEACSLPMAGVDSNSSSTQSFQAEIEYEPALSLKLSFLGRLVFGDGLKWTEVKRYGYLSWQILFLVAAVAFELMLWAILWFSEGPLGGQEVVIIMLAILVPLAATKYFQDVFRFWENRIVIAPDWALAWKETGATIEINRAKNSDQPSTILVRRYTTTCPICGWMVKLDRGEPDFPNRIIGRCEENPSEHVFSFDRSTRKGASLRTL